MRPPLTTRAPAPPGPAERYAWMDNLRVAVIAGVIVFHVATAYILDISWYYEERTASDVTEGIVAAIAMPAVLFAMAMLFLVAGMLTARSLARTSGRNFWRGRLLRLGVPLVFYIPLVDPATSVLGRWGSGDYQPGDVGAMVRDEFSHPQSGPMWFVMALLTFSMGYAVLRRFRPAGVGTPLRRRHLVLAAAVIVVTTFLVRLVWPFAGPTPLALNLWEWPQMGVMFAFGTVAQERRWLDPPPPWLAPLCLRAGIVASVAVILLLIPIAAGDNPDPFIGGWHLQALAEPTCEATLAVTMSLWFTLWFARHVTYDGRLASALGRGSYAAYLVHAPVIVALSVALHGVGVVAEVKFVAVAVVGVAVSFALGWLLTPRPHPRMRANR